MKRVSLPLPIGPKRYKICWVADMALESQLCSSLLLIHHKHLNVLCFFLQACIPRAGGSCHEWHCHLFCCICLFTKLHIKSLSCGKNCRGLWKWLVTDYVFFFVTRLTPYLLLPRTSPAASKRFCSVIFKTRLNELDSLPESFFPTNYKPCWYSIYSWQ